jgi:thiamine-phosphate pyrophosphorylase
MITAVISSTEMIEKEAVLANTLFEAGLKYFHLRKPGTGINHIINFLNQINPGYLNRIILHNNHDILGKYNVKGLHFNQYNIVSANRPFSFHASYSAHSCEEILEIEKYHFDYAFLSPVFDSISKVGYNKQFDNEFLFEFFRTVALKTPVVALGGVDEENVETAVKIGFKGIAFLGAIWVPFKAGVSETRIVDKYLRMEELCNKDLVL